MRYSALIIPFFSSVCFFFWIFSLPTPTEVEISKQSIQKIDGYAYATKIPTIDGTWIKVALGDTNDTPNRSKTKLLENGLEIGIPHTLHQSISTIGKGGFSHWHNMVYFSAADNSDPATNDMRYSLKITLERPTSLTLFLIGAPIALLLWSIALSTSLSTSMKVAGAALSIFILTMAAVAVYNQYAFLKSNFWPLCLSFDSIGYLASDGSRPPGYPEFLNVVLSAMGNLNNLTLSQFLISMATSIYFGIAVARLFGIIFIGCLSSLILICTTPHMIYGTNVLSEGLFIPVLITYFAVLADYLRTNKKTFLCAAGLVLVTLVSVRTIGLAVVPAFILICLPIHKGLSSLQSRDFQAPFIALFFSILALQTGSGSRGDSGSHGFAGWALLGHVAQLDSHETGSSDNRDIRRELSEVIKEVSAPCGSEITSNEYLRCTANNYNTLLYLTITPFLTKKLEEDGRPPSFDQITAFSTELAFEIILDNPLQYVSYIANVISGMWSYTLNKHIPIQRQLDQCIPATKEIHKRNREYLDNKFTLGKFENQRATTRLPNISLPTFERFNYFIDSKRKLLNNITFGLSVLAIAIVFFKTISRPHRLFLLSASLSLWAYYLLVAMMQPGITRYIHAFEPVAWTIILSSFGIVLSKLFGQLNLPKRR